MITIPDFKCSKQSSHGREERIEFIISEVKKSVLPIFCRRVITKDSAIFSSGSSVYVGQGDNTFFLTCEHILVDTVTGTSYKLEIQNGVLELIPQ